MSRTEIIVRIGLVILASAPIAYWIYGITTKVPVAVQGLTMTLISWVALLIICLSPQAVSPTRWILIKNIIVGIAAIVLLVHCASPEQIAPLTVSAAAVMIFGQILVGPLAGLEAHIAFGRKGTLYLVAEVGWALLSAFPLSFGILL